MGEQTRSKDATIVEFMQLRQPSKKHLSDIAVWCIRQTPWGKTNGEFLMEVWDFDDAAGKMPQHPTLTGALDAKTLEAVTRACLRILGRKDLAAQIQERRPNKGEGRYGNRTGESSGGTAKGGSEKGKRTPEETDIMALRRLERELREKYGEDKRHRSDSAPRWEEE